LHNAFLTLNGEKTSKSLGNGLYLADIVEKGYHPLALRYFFLQAHYRTPLSFSWEALASASVGLERLWKTSRQIAEESKCVSQSSDAYTHFIAAIRDDLATPQALAILWDALKSEEYAPEEKWGLIEGAEAHLGLSLIEPPLMGSIKNEDIPTEVQEMLRNRELARTSKDFEAADRIRSEIEARGYRVDDGPSGAVLTKGSI